MEKILIIEDDPAHSDMYKIAFSREFEVSTAFDGEAGWTKAKIEKPRVILLDVLMPKMSGMQVLERLKADPETQAIPVVVMTNLTETDVENSAMKLGAYMCISKQEYVPNQIVELVKKLVQAIPRATDPVASSSTTPDTQN